MSAADIARHVARLFAAYRRHMEQARDPDEPRPKRDAAWSRAAKCRCRIERSLDQLAEKHA